MEKILSTKALLKMAGGGDASPTSPPPTHLLDPPLAVLRLLQIIR